MARDVDREQNACLARAGTHPLALQSQKRALIFTIKQGFILVFALLLYIIEMSYNICV